jgi:hypothetical protein
VTTLAERAAAAAGRATIPPYDPQDPDGPGEPYEQPAPETDPMADYEPGEDDPEMVPVHVAWLRVRREIRAIAKDGKYEQGKTKYNYRGADTVVQHFGPVTLKHGVHVFPVEVRTQYGEKSTNAGGKMRECTATVTWLIMGPKGDTLTLQTAGEALDTSDKSTTKAQTVALRTLLLTAGLTPTGDPDPDTQRIERGEAPARTAASYQEEILQPGISRQRLVQINYEIKQAGLFGTEINNELDQPEQLGAFLFRIGQERIQGGAA